MIHDAKIEVTCDTPSCNGWIEIQPQYVYGGINHTDGRYDVSDKAINKELITTYDWTVVDGKHFCERCSSEKE